MISLSDSNIVGELKIPRILRPCLARNYKKNAIFRENGFEAVLKKWGFSERMVFGIYIKMAFFRVDFIFFKFELVIGDFS